MKLLISIAVGLVHFSQASAPLTLPEFLNQVTERHQGIQGSKRLSEGAAKTAEMGTLLLAPTLFGSAMYLNDKKPQNNPAITGDHILAKNFQLGVSKLTTFGLQSTLSYNVAYTNMIGANAAFMPITNFVDAHPELDLTQSLWRNGFGAATRADQQRIEAEQLTTQFSQSYQAKFTLAQAEIAYWRLALARETVQVQKESLDRAVKIRDWSQRRANLQLADKADLYQAEAALEVRRLDYQASIDDERTSARGFNSARGADSDLVEEDLSSPDADWVQGQATPARMELRDDVRAASENRRVVEARTELDLQTLSPDLQIFGSLAYNGRADAGLGNDISAFHDSFTTQRPTWSAGLRFSAPLDLPTIARSRAGQRQTREGADLAFERKLFEQETEWKDLVHKLDEAKRRFKLSRMIEQAQKIKLVHEKDRHSKGRTTTYQVLLFEQDFASAQLGRIRAEGDILQLVAQMKVYGEAK